MHLGWRDLKAQYARTKLGPIWSAASLAAIITGSTVAISLIGNTDALNLTPRLAIGLAIWTLIASSLNEGADLYEAERSLILNSKLVIPTLVFRIIWRNCVIFLHNLPVIGLALWIGNYKPTVYLLLLVPLSFLIAPALVLPISIFARLAVWRRDLKSLLPSLITVGLYLSPVFWSPPESGNMRLIFDLNPFGWFIVLVQDSTLNDNFHSDLFIRCIVAIVTSLFACQFFENRLYKIRKFV